MSKKVKYIDTSEQTYCRDPLSQKSIKISQSRDKSRSLLDLMLIIFR